MPKIPDSINNVVLEFAEGVDRDVSQELLDALRHTISNEVDGVALNKLWISSAKDKHRCPSRHVTGNGVDISRVNGKKIGVYYSNTVSVKKIVDRLQMSFETADNRRENYGPAIIKKLGQDRPIAGHGDHIHWSVNGDHTGCVFSIVDYMAYHIDRVFRRKDGVCNK